MDRLEQQIGEARENKEAMNELVRRYLPFIKSQASKIQLASLDEEDRQSIAMLVFANCVAQYQPARGGFLSFAGACIRNRLIDESRKTAGRVPTLPLHGEDEALSAEDTASIQQYDKEREHRQLCEEIDELSARLTPFAIAFAELPRVCPKHRKSRAQCLRIARFIADNPSILNKLLLHRRLSQNELAEHFRLSVKTIEKHRKYIITLALLLTGDFPGIQAFLPRWKEADE